MKPFSFGTALQYFSDAPGSGAFFWRYLLAFIAVNIALSLAMTYALSALAPHILTIFEGIAENPNPQAILNILPQLLGVGLIAGLIYLAVWAVFESARQRHYVRQEPFSMRFGADELRLMLLAVAMSVLFFLLYLAIMIVLALLGGIFSMGGDAATPLTIVLLIAAFGVFALFAVRLSAASALTIRDSRFVLFGSWGVTSGKFWAMFFANLVMIIAVLLVVLATVFLLLPLMLNSGDGAVAIALTGSPLLLSGGLMWAIYILAQAINQGFGATITYMFAGIPAKAVNDDPNSMRSVNTINATFE